MAQPQKPWRAKNEDVKTPRQYNGNVFAVGAYLKRLRELHSKEEDGWSREKFAEKVRNQEKGLIRLSMSAVNVIEGARMKSFDVAMISAMVRSLGGTMDDIDELLHVDFEETDESFRESRRIGAERANRRWTAMHDGEEVVDVVLDMASTTDMRQTLRAVLTSDELQEVVKLVKDDPDALALVLSMLRRMSH